MGLKSYVALDESYFSEPQTPKTFQFKYILPSLFFIFVEASADSVLPFNLKVSPDLTHL